jgi:hypothetical protein
LKEILVKERWAGEVEARFGHPAKLREDVIDSPEQERFIWSVLLEAGLGSAVAVRPCIMGVLRESAYQNKPNILLSTDAY